VASPPQCPPLCHPEETTRRWRVKREMNDFALFGGWLSYRPPLSRLPAKPRPLDGCPMFADFRVHGLNKSFSNAFTTGLHLLAGKEKGGVSPIFFNPCTRKREHGAPVQGARLVSKREICRPTNVRRLPLLGNKPVAVDSWQRVGTTMAGCPIQARFWLEWDTTARGPEEA
jgi:hypothetical protein